MRIGHSLRRSTGVVRLAVAACALTFTAADLAAQAEASGGGSGADAAYPGAAVQRASTPGLVYPVRRASGAIEVDAVLDEPAWREAVSIPIPIEITPRDNIAAEVRTDCRVTFDEDHLYLGCVAYDPRPREIRAYVTDRDGIFGDNDRISMLVDPFDDRRRGFVFEVSPLGVQADLVYDERTSSFDENWDGIWDSAGRITDDGYRIEAAIPFKTLRFPNTRGPQRWRFWINRMRPRSDFAVYRTNTRLRGEDCQLCQAHVLEGFEGIDPGLNLEVVPTLTGDRTDVAGGDPGDPLTPGDIDIDAGLDARWNVTTNLALNATVNPDFSQVEADAPQLDANNPFALRFPEKRPFFLEGADLFATPLEVVFTRTIADPIAGAKFTGKDGRHGMGALVAADEVNNLIFPGPFSSTGTSLDEGVHTVVARYRSDIGSGHSAGVVYTGRLGESAYSNHAVGVDVFFRPLPELRVDVQALRTRTRYPDELARAFDQPARAFSGHALDAAVRYQGRRWGANASTQIRTPGARFDAGFVPQADVRRTDLSGRHTFWGDGSPFASIEVAGGAWHYDTTSGERITSGLWTNLFYEGPAQSEAWLNPFVERRAFAGEEHDLLSVAAGFSLRPTRAVRVGISGDAGERIDFRNGGVGDQIRLSPSIDLRVGRRTEIGMRHSYQRLSRDARPIFTANIGELTTVYNMSPRAFARIVLQYRRTSRDPARNPDLARELEEDLFTQALLSYKLNPLTVVFLGITDDRAGFVDAEQDAVGLSPRDRRFFFKLGYAWRA